MDSSSTTFSAQSGSPELPLWQPVPGLLGVKSKARLVLRLALRGRAGSWGLGLSARALLSGLSQQELADLLAALRDKRPSRAWSLQLQEGLRLACVAGEGAAAQLRAAAADAPHLLVLEAEALRREEGLLDMLLGWRGALLLLEGSETEDGRAPLALQVTTRWRKDEKQGCLISEPFQAWLHDIELDAEGNYSAECPSIPGLDEVVGEQLGPLYQEDFCADLANLALAQRDYGLRLALLLEHGSQGPQLLGFLLYKAWSGLRPGVSVAAVGVPMRQRGRGFGRRLMEMAEREAAAVAGRVYLRSLPLAVPFYVRMGYLPICNEAESRPSVTTLKAAAASLYKEGEIDEDASCVPMMSRGAARPEGPRRDAEPWSQRISQHLEEGPTWIPISQLMRA